MTTAESIARAFHGTYEELAPKFGYETRMRSRVDWEEVPEDNRKLMIAVVTSLLLDGIIVAGEGAKLPNE